MRALLSQMQKIAERHRARTDPKLARLIEWIRAHLMESDRERWNNRRVVVFTEYADARTYIHALPARGVGHRRAIVAIFDGQMIEDGPRSAQGSVQRKSRGRAAPHLAGDRRSARRRQPSKPLLRPVSLRRPLESSRMEQRNGRIDRKLQRSPGGVAARYFVYRQRPDDKVLEALVQKTRKILKELGSLSEVVDRNLGEQLREASSPAAPAPARPRCSTCSPRSSRTTSGS